MTTKAVLEKTITPKTYALAMNLTRLEKTNNRGIKGRVKRAGRNNSNLEKILKV